MSKKRLYRSRDDRMIAGVCGGIAEYFAIDPVVVRLFMLVFGVCAGGGILAYVILWALVPEKPKK